MTPLQVLDLSRAFGGFHSHARWYVRSKLLLDPVYDASWEAINQTGQPNLPLLDLGCGLGVLIASLRQQGWRAPALGLDYDSRKIVKARQLAQDHPLAFGDCHFEQTDLRRGLPSYQGHVAILDILQFFTRPERNHLLSAAAACVAPGAALVIRQTLDNQNRRVMSRATDRFARLTHWMQDDATDYPSASELIETLAHHGLHGQFRHLPGRLPLDNWFATFHHK